MCQLLTQQENWISDTWRGAQMGALTRHINMRDYLAVISLSVHYDAS